MTSGWSWFLAAWFIYFVLLKYIRFFGHLIAYFRYKPSKPADNPKFKPSNVAIILPTVDQGKAKIPVFKGLLSCFKNKPALIIITTVPSAFHECVKIVKQLGVQEKRLHPEAYPGESFAGPSTQHLLVASPSGRPSFFRSNRPASLRPTSRQSSQPTSRGPSVGAPLPGLREGEYQNQKGDQSQEEGNQDQEEGDQGQEEGDQGQKEGDQGQKKDQSQEGYSGITNVKIIWIEQANKREQLIKAVDIIEEEKEELTVT